MRSLERSLVLHVEKAIGIPDFWMQVMKRSDVVSESIKVSVATVGR